ncbi:MAG: hypothetical protein OXC08_14795 [Thiotrichales bacterium]|nr:hypothetical protein [Thiotrichales bacterium]
MVVGPDDLELPPEEDAIGNAIREAVNRGQINRWAVPDRIVLADSLDKTSVGKVDKKRLRARYSKP